MNLRITTTTIVCFCCSLLFTSCSAQKTVRSIRLDAQHLVLLPDSASASQKIVYDPVDRFFERITAVEMSIQLKKPLADCPARPLLLDEYRRFLQHDVADFSAKESKMLEKTVISMYELCRQYPGGIFPDTLILVKTKGRHYGPGVYYTRANCIVIPADALEGGPESGLSMTLFHELMHVYNRMNPEKRLDLYRLIGFEPLGYETLVLPPRLLARLLHNPDGVDFAQCIRLRNPDSTTVRAVPVIYAGSDGYQPGKPQFFNYFQFGLYAIEPLPDGRWKLITKPDGISSTLDLGRLPDFYRQIRDNTGYIIHPDEIIADNFAFLMADRAGYGSSRNFSSAGRELLKKMEKILSAGR